MKKLLLGVPVLGGVALYVKWALRKVTEAVESAWGVEPQRRRP